MNSPILYLISCSLHTDEYIHIFHVNTLVFANRHWDTCKYLVCETGVITLIFLPQTQHVMCMFKFDLDYLTCEE